MTVAQLITIKVEPDSAVLTLSADADDPIQQEYVAHGCPIPEWNLSQDETRLLHLWLVTVVGVRLPDNFEEARAAVQAHKASA